MWRINSSETQGHTSQLQFTVTQFSQLLKKAKRISGSLLCSHASCPPSRPHKHMFNLPTVVKTVQQKKRDPKNVHLSGLCSQIDLKCNILLCTASTMSSWAEALAANVKGMFRAECSVQCKCKWLYPQLHGVAFGEKTLPTLSFFFFFLMIQQLIQRMFAFFDFWSRWTSSCLNMRRHVIITWLLVCVAVQRVLYWFELGTWNASCFNNYVFTVLVYFESLGKSAWWHYYTGRWLHCSVHWTAVLQCCAVSSAVTLK